jgi:metal-responsive CopG/Arc/MetJ family transcriptional regulator
MKVKTSVSLSEELLRQLDEIVGKGGNRSQFIEMSLRRAIREARRSAEFDHEVALLNAIMEGPEPPEDPEDLLLGDPAHLLVDLE